MSKGPGLFSSLRHRDYALFISAFTTSSIGSWAYNVALVVWIIDATDSTGWVAVAAVCRFVPALLFSAYGGVLAERFERVRLMLCLDLILFLVMVAMAVAMTLDLPAAVVVATAAISSTVFTAYEPAAAAMTPLLVGEQDLGSANALRNTIDNVCVVAGPGLGAVLLLLGEPGVTVAINAATFLASALLLSAIRTRSRPVDVTEGGEVGPLRQMLVGIRAISTSSSAAVLVAFCLIVTMVFGMDTVLFVVLSRDVLGTGAEGYGYLLAGLGVGGVLAAGLVTRLERRPRLGLVIWLGTAGYCMPTALFLVVDDPTLAFVIECVRGASTLVVDVLAITALQRSLPNDLLGRVFGAFNALCLLAVLIGSSVVPFGISWFGLDAVLWATGLGIPVLCLAGWPWLRRMDKEAALRRTAMAPKLALLARCDLFSAVSEGALDQLAGAADFVDAEPSTVIVRQGEPADAFYVIDAGAFSVSAHGEDGRALSLQDMEEGNYFGEIGLIEGIPRTATVTARTAGRLLRVDGASFVAALTQAGPSAALMDGASVRLNKTNPHAQLSRAAIASAPHEQD